MRKEYDFSRLKQAEPKYLKRRKEAVTMRLDPLVLSYFKSLGSKTGVPYQSLVNYVLKDYANHGLEPSAQWNVIGRTTLDRNRKTKKKPAHAKSTSSRTMSSND